MALDVKEMWGYIALDESTELNSTAEGSEKEMTYELPNGNIITVGADRFRVSTLKHPIDHVVATKCDDLETIWHQLHR